jgi:hypothetical protein
MTAIIKKGRGRGKGKKEREKKKGKKKEKEGKGKKESGKKKKRERKKERATRIISKQSNLHLVLAYFRTIRTVLSVFLASTA